MAIPYRRFGTTYRSHLPGPWIIGTFLRNYTASHQRRQLFTLTSDVCSFDVLEGGSALFLSPVPVAAVWGVSMWRAAVCAVRCSGVLGAGWLGGWGAVGAACGVQRTFGSAWTYRSIHFSKTFTCVYYYCYYLILTKRNVKLPVRYHHLTLVRLSHRALLWLLLLSSSSSSSLLNYLYHIVDWCHSLLLLVLYYLYYLSGILAVALRCPQYK